MLHIEVRGNQRDNKKANFIVVQLIAHKASCAWNAFRLRIAADRKQDYSGRLHETALHLLHYQIFNLFLNITQAIKPKIYKISRLAKQEDKIKNVTTHLAIRTNIL